MLYIILLYRFEVFLGGSIHQSNTIEPAVQPVLNGWTNEPANRQPHQFDVRSSSNNYALKIQVENRGQPQFWIRNQVVYNLRQSMRGTNVTRYAVVQGEKYLLATSVVLQAWEESAIYRAWFAGHKTICSTDDEQSAATHRQVDSVVQEDRGSLSLSTRVQPHIGSRGEPKGQSGRLRTTLKFDSKFFQYLGQVCFFKFQSYVPSHRMFKH